MNKLESLCDTVTSGVLLERVKATWPAGLPVRTISLFAVDVADNYAL